MKRIVRFVHWVRQSNWPGIIGTLIGFTLLLAGLYGQAFLVITDVQWVLDVTLIVLGAVILIVIYCGNSPN